MVNDESDIFLIDSHAEGVGCSYYAGPTLHETVLDIFLYILLKSRMEKLARDVGILEKKR